MLPTKKRKVGGRVREMSEFLSTRGSAPTQSRSSSQASQLQPAPPPPQTLLESAERQEIIGRGHNIGVRVWNTGDKLDVQFDERFQVIGPQAKKLKSQLGIIVRDGHRIPMTILDWKGVDATVKEGIWREVQDNLLHAPSGYKDVCLLSCNLLWKDHKTKIKKKYFEPNKNNPNLLSMVPEGVVPEQWHVLVDYWRCDHSKAISARNSINRELHGPLHVTGRKPYAQVRFEMEKSGEPTDKMSVWLKARNPDDDDVVQARMDYQEALDKEPEDQRHLTCVKDRIFHHLIGKDGHGYCRTYGSSVPRSLVYPHDPVVRNNTSESELVEKISKKVIEEVSKKLTEEFSILTRQWGMKYDELTSRMDRLEENGETTPNPHALVPTDANSHRRESVGDGMNLSASAEVTSPREDES